MDTLQRMRNQLQPLKLYQWREDSLVLAEMKAYALIIDRLLQRLEDMKRECCFVPLHHGQRARYCWLFGFPFSPPTGMEEAEWEAVLEERMRQRMLLGSQDFTVQGIQKAIATRGMQVEFEENFATRHVTVRVVEDMGLIPSQAEKEWFIRQYMPVHSTVTVVFDT